MHFAQPHWLLIGLLACLGLMFLFRFMQKRRQAALEKFAAHQLIGRLTQNISGRKRWYKNILLLLAVFFAFAALARPQYGFQWVDVKRKGIDLLFALDTSKSMLAEDIKPNRLKRAHLAILDFVTQLDGDRVGLIPFAGSAYLMCPLTLDYEAFADSLAAVTTDIIPRGGTNIASVIDMAAETLNNTANHKILIILTDGENLEGDAIKAAENGAKAGLTIYTVGVGTSQGELIPVAAENGKGFVKDQNGNFVTSRLDEKTLAALAEKTGGLYVPLGTAGEGLETIYKQKLALIPKEELAERRQKVPLERFEWPLAAAILFLVVELLLGERKKARPIRPLSAINTMVNWFRRRRKTGATTALILLLGLSLAPRAYCSSGEEAYAQKDYLQASEYYRQKLEKSPDDPELLYNFGTAAYKNNMFDEAIDAFTKALTSDDIKLQEKAYYNRGNSYYQKGAEAQQADPKAAIGQWQEALNSLDSALKLDPQNADARHNHQLIEKRLEELKKQQQQQQNNKDQQDQQKKDQQQQSGSEQQHKDNAEQQDKKQQQSGSDKQQPGDKQSTDSNDGTDAQKNDSGRQQPPQPADKENGKTDTPKPINKSPEKNNPAAGQTDQGSPQQPGEMTQKEAQSLLNALKNEEGELNFVPSAGNNTENPVNKDW
ncbi:VWA domain-containing protein [Desulfopila sp. IMCC35006]|uniref:vWA domain-containing protein n=1 Tax=Desulfopila sp. IMCC35006 TaxID=2569542 RepID=UPI0010AB9424|nr:VWA domain-containing protein [Desulfopila sp. IMCC35006]TKB24285.1 VWA domain-containing protein [Desulfopila sp. IMCC35006]